MDKYGIWQDGGSVAVLELGSWQDGGTVNLGSEATSLEADPVVSGIPVLDATSITHTTSLIADAVLAGVPVIDATTIIVVDNQRPLYMSILIATNKKLLLRLR